MNTVFNLCKLLIDRGRTDGLQDKMDVYLAADRLTPEEYQELAGLLPRNSNQQRDRWIKGCESNE